MRYYPTGKRLDVRKLRLKLSTPGKTFYLTKHVHHLIQRSSEGIASIPLIFESMKNLRGEVILPLYRMTNKLYRRILGALYHLEDFGYVERKKEEPRRGEEEYYVHSRFLHKELRKNEIRRTVKINEKEYGIRSLSFDEALSQALLSFFLVAEGMLVPTTKSRIAERLGYKETTVKHSISVLRVYNLVERKENRYQLKGDLEKIEKLMEMSGKAKRKKVERLLTCGYFLDFHQGRAIPSDFVLRIGKLHPSTASQWLSDKRPRINEKVAELLLQQGLISRKQLEMLDRHGLITSLYSDEC